MKDSQDKTTSPSQPELTPLSGSQPKSSFNEAEYQRWSEKLRKQYGYKNEENQTPWVEARSLVTEYDS
jgi:hypothetical protein